jgi:hypothetical protein
MNRRLEIWMIGFVAGLVVAIVLGMSSSHVRRQENSEPGNGDGPNRMQLSPKSKSKSVRYALAADAVAS